MENKAARFLAFDSLKGLKEAVEEVDSLTTKKKYPYLSMEKRDEMDNILYRSYLHKIPVEVSYMHHKSERTVTGIIVRLDAVRHIIKTEDGISIYLAEITDLRMKDVLFEDA